MPTGFFLGLVYCIINPIMCPTVLLFFLVSILAEKYNAMYVFKSRYQSGGLLWPTVRTWVEGFLGPDCFQIWHQFGCRLAFVLVLAMGHGSTRCSSSS